jgi:hypothetical protein
MWTPRASADDLQEVPLAQLLAEGPQTFTFSGTKTWDKDGLGRPLTLTQTWTATVTLERQAS